MVVRYHRYYRTLAIETYLHHISIKDTLHAMFSGKRLKSRRKNVLSMLAFTLLEYVQLNQITFGSLFGCYFFCEWFQVEYSLTYL